MARRRERSEPKVPRSTADQSYSKQSGPPAARLTTPTPVSFEEQYSHVRRDLMRILTFGGLIFAIMLVLRFAVGL